MRQPDSGSSRAGRTVRTTGRDDVETRVGWRMAGIGFTVATEVAAGAALGYLFDRWFGTGTTGTLIGGIAGIAVGMWTLIQRTLTLNRELDARSPTRGRAKPIPPDQPWRDDHDETDNDHSTTDDTHHPSQHAERDDPDGGRGRPGGADERADAG